MLTWSDQSDITLDNEGAASRVGSLSPPTPPLSCQPHLPAGQKLSSGLLGLSQDQGALWNAKRLVVKLINYLRSVLLHDVPDGVCDAMTRGDPSLQPAACGPNKISCLSNCGHWDCEFALFVSSVCRRLLTCTSHFHLQTMTSSLEDWLLYFLNTSYTCCEQQQFNVNIWCNWYACQSC